MAANRAVATSLVAFAVTLTGCTAMRDNPTLCKVIYIGTGATLGAVGGGVGTDKIGNAENNGEIAAGAAAGFVGGGLIGGVLGHFLCPEPEPPPPVVKAPPPPPPPARGTKISVIEGPHFAFDKSTLTPEGRRKVAGAAKVLKDNPSVNVTVDGYTDSVGSDAYNMRLGERRAHTVERALVDEGISPSRMTVRSFGKKDPVASNATAEGRAQNRRVELVVK